MPGHRQVGPAADPPGKWEKIAQLVRDEHWTQVQGGFCRSTGGWTCTVSRWLRWYCSSNSCEVWMGGRRPEAEGDRPRGLDLVHVEEPLWASSAEMPREEGRLTSASSCRGARSLSANWSWGSYLEITIVAYFELGNLPPEQNPGGLAAASPTVIPGGVDHTERTRG